ncbi:hypothetical protein M6B38_381925 [Iris pallida]|uniref:Uncharacterized protein n=1 Tax=Iris pallida TaxID=29817 RepID=A0AAX6G833_IRIPA|nr:hypothetical protein M6B38_381925 [Iris pallida]
MKNNPRSGREEKNRTLSQYHSRENETISRKIFCSMWGDESLVHPPGLLNDTHVIKYPGRVLGPTAGSITSQLLALFFLSVG